MKYVKRYFYFVILQHFNFNIWKVEASSQQNNLMFHKSIILDYKAAIKLIICDHKKTDQCKYFNENY